MPTRFLLAAVLSLTFLSGPAQAERRCGWLQNPTPANWSLTDAGGEWTIMSQGGAEPPGLDMIPDLSTGQTINRGRATTACACMSVQTSAKTMSIVEITGFKQMPLATCLADRNLPKP